MNRHLVFVCVACAVASSCRRNAPTPIPAASVETAEQIPRAESSGVVARAPAPRVTEAPCGKGAWCQLPIHQYPATEDGDERELHSVWCSSGRDVWIGGNDRLIHYDGARLREEEAPEHAQVTALWGTSAKSVFATAAVGDKGVVLRFDGASWTTTHLPKSAGSPPTAIWGSSDGDVYVGSDALTHFDGKRWTDVELPEFTKLGPFAIAGTGPRDVYVIAAYGGIRFDGKRWKELLDAGNSHLSTVNISALWCGARNDVIAVGRHESEDGVGEQDYVRFDGKTWEMLPTGSKDALTAIAGRDRAHLYAIGEKVYRFNGKTWPEDKRAGASKLDTPLRGLATCGDCVVVVSNKLVWMICE